MCLGGDDDILMSCSKVENESTWKLTGDVAYSRRILRSMTSHIDKWANNRARLAPWCIYAPWLSMPVTHIMYNAATVEYYFGI